MYTDTEVIMDGMLDKAMKNKRVKQAKEAVNETADVIRNDGLGIMGRIVVNLLKAVLYAPIAIIVMPFVSAFKNRKKQPSKSFLNR